MTTFEVMSLAGLLSGILDLTATSTLVRAQGVQFERLLQTIASGALGPSAFQGGKKTATAGFFVHSLYSLHRRCRLLRGRPRDDDASRPSAAQRPLVWRRRPPVDEPSRGPTLRCTETRVFSQNFPLPTSHPHVLRWAAYRSHR